MKKRLTYFISCLIFVFGMISCNLDVGKDLTKGELIELLDKTDTQAPSEVTNVQIKADSTSVIITWTDATETDIFGYEVYLYKTITNASRAISSMPYGTILVAPKTEKVAIADLIPNTFYSLEIKSMDVIGNKSVGVKKTFKTKEEITIDTNLLNKTINDIEIEKTSEILVTTEPVTVEGSKNYALSTDTKGVFVEGRTVEIKPFAMGQYEVTQALYEAVMNSNPSGFDSNPAEGEIQKNRPVERINWLEAIQFCNNLTVLTFSEEDCVYTIDDNNQVSWDFSKKGYRLPTEAEWEFAARGGNPSTDENSEWMKKFIGTGEYDDVEYYAWTCNNSDYITHEVGLKLPNSIGLYDMTGNVWEWCMDNGYLWNSSNLEDPYPETYSPVDVIRRGGSYYLRDYDVPEKDQYSVCSRQYHNIYDNYDSCHGIRVCRTIVTGNSSETVNPPISTPTFNIASEGITVDGTLYNKTGEIYVIPESAGNVTVTCYDKGDVFCGNRTVTLSPYTMSQYEVTQELYQAIMSGNPSYYTGNLKPVDSANWYQAIAFCNKLSALLNLEIVYFVDGITDWKNISFSDVPQDFHSSWENVSIDISKNGYRLPTEAEWEFAARGGNCNDSAWGKRYSGSNISSMVAWTSENTGNYQAQEVGKKAPNSIGLYDMNGNQWEWCNDRYANISTETSNSINPVNLSVGIYRTQRGGSWKDPSSEATNSYRRSDSCGGGPSAHWVDWGFRLCRSLTNVGSSDGTVYSDNSQSNTQSALPIPDGLTSLPSKNEDIGNIVCSDGTIITLEDFLESDKTPVAVICGYDSTGSKLGIGLQQCSDLAWCTTDSSSFSQNDPTFPNIVASFFRSEVLNGYKYKNLGFDGDLQGFDNWEEIVLVDSSAISNMETNYPLFYFAENYSSSAGIENTEYSDNWFIPTIFELYQIYTNMDVINKSLSACNASLLTRERYWTSSEWKYDSTRTFDDLSMGSAWDIDFNNGHINPEWCGKSCCYKACAIHKF